MFVCNFESKCRELEEEERKRYTGSNTAFIRGLKIISWNSFHRWDRSDCNADCEIHLMLELESYEKFLQSGVIQRISALRGVRYEAFYSLHTGDNSPTIKPLMKTTTPK